MAPLTLILILLLQFEGGISQHLTVYTTSGHDAVLSCASSLSSDTTCSIVTWIYSRDPSKTFSLVQKGNVDKSSARAARLSLDTNCDLVINNITAEDAGLYTCRRGSDAYYDVYTLLNVLTVSPDPPDADPKREDEVTLHCSLFRYRNLGPRPQNSIRWVDETGTVLLGEGVGYKLVRQMNCVSVLTVKRQSDNNRRYTCQVVDEKNNVKTEADYTPVFPGGISQDLTVYTTSGHDAVLSCASSLSSDTRCSIVTWIYNRDTSKTFSLVQNGNVDKSSARAARLSLDTNCDLVINNITAEDAGLYTCRRGSDAYYDVNTQLNVLTVSPDPPDADPKREDEVTLHCSLFRSSDLGPRPQNSIRWVDETGTVLLGEGVGYKLVRQMNCVSVLTVKRQSDNNRRYTCQVVDEKNNVKMEADYTPVFTDSSQLTHVMLALRIAGLILMIVVTFLVISLRGNIKPLDKKNNVNNDADEVQYENVEADPATSRLHQSTPTSTPQTVKSHHSQE